MSMCKVFKALFITAPSGSRSDTHCLGEGKSKLLYVHTKDNYSAIEKNEGLIKSNAEGGSQT